MGERRGRRAPSLGPRARLVRPAAAGFDGVTRDHDALGEPHGEVVAPGDVCLIAGRLIDEEWADDEVRVGGEKLGECVGAQTRWSWLGGRPQGARLRARHVVGRDRRDGIRVRAVGHDVERGALREQPRWYGGSCSIEGLRPRDGNSRGPLRGDGARVLRCTVVARQRGIPPVHVCARPGVLCDVLVAHVQDEGQYEGHPGEEENPQPREALPLARCKRSVGACTHWIVAAHFSFLPLRSAAITTSAARTPRWCR